MAEKEVLDYVKLQRSIGVKDSDIHKALVTAGYDRGDIVEHMTHKDSRPMMKKVKRLQIEEKHLFFMNIMTIFLVIGLFVYMSYDFHVKLTGNMVAQNSSVQLLEERMGQRLNDLSREITNVAEDVDVKVDLAKSELKVDDGLIRQSVQKTEDDSRIRDSVLSVSIQEISNKSSSDLVALSSQLEQVQKERVDFSKIVPKAIPSVVSVGTLAEHEIFFSHGSGAIINQNGYVITNYHVIDELGDRVYVVTSGNDRYAADVIGFNKTYDIAVLKIQSAKKFSSLFWADSDSLYVGEPVIAIGNPVGLDATVTQGIISNRNRFIDGQSIAFIQTDVAINVGNSGGPMLDKDGRIVGILTRKMIGSGLEGLGFAVKSNDAKKIANNMIIHQK